jgi:hypothetical protein
LALKNERIFALKFLFFPSKPRNILTAQTCNPKSYPQIAKSNQRPPAHFAKPLYFCRINKTP